MSDDEYIQHLEHGYACTMQYLAGLMISTMDDDDIRAWIAEESWISLPDDCVVDLRTNLNDIKSESRRLETEFQSFAREYREGK